LFFFCFCFSGFFFGSIYIKVQIFCTCTHCWRVCVHGHIKAREDKQGKKRRMLQGEIRVRSWWRDERVWWHAQVQSVTLYGGLLAWMGGCTCKESCSAVELGSLGVVSVASTLVAVVLVLSWQETAFFGVGKWMSQMAVATSMFVGFFVWEVRQMGPGGLWVRV
jgi:hypothetical protein